LELEQGIEILMFYVVSVFGRSWGLRESWYAICLCWRQPRGNLIFNF
jgi:hypothetical protein